MEREEAVLSENERNEKRRNESAREFFFPTSSFFFSSPLSTTLCLSLSLSRFL